jgi:hypothetical protein
MTGHIQSRRERHLSTHAGAPGNEGRAGGKAILESVSLIAIQVRPRSSGVQGQPQGSAPPPSICSRMTTQVMAATAVYTPRDSRTDAGWAWRAPAGAVV